jgi:rhomboid protease GluP
VRQLLPDVEQVYGRARTIIIFTLSGVVCFLLSDFVGTAFTVGASGAIFGLLAAMVWYGRRRGGFFGSAVLRQYGTWALVLFVLGLISGTGVNNWGHAGGLIGGFLAAFLFGPTHERPEHGTDRVLAGATLVLTAAAFALQLWTTFVR